MKRFRVLIVEDCEHARGALLLGLTRDYEVDAVGDAESALLRISSSHYDLVIIDLGLPGMDGYKFCASVKSSTAFADLAIVILSGRTSVEDKVMGFSLGAADYVQKPVDLRELRARIQFQLSRKEKEEVQGRRLQAGPLECDLLKQSISYSDRRGEKIEVAATPIEFKLLHYFLTHIGHVISRRQLLDHAWGKDRNVTERSVDAQISKLRQKLGPHAHFLQAVHGAGYRFRISHSTPNETGQKAS